MLSYASIIHHLLQRLRLQDAINYLESFYSIDTIRLQEFVEAEMPTTDQIAFIKAYLLNRYFVLLLEHGQDRQQADLQARLPDTEAYCEWVLAKLRGQLPELAKHPDFKLTMFALNGYYSYYKLHGPYFKLILAPDDYPTFHQAVAEEPALSLQQAMLYSFGYTLLAMEKPALFAQFWLGVNGEQRKGKRLQKLHQLYQQRYVLPAQE